MSSSLSAPDATSTSLPPEPSLLFYNLKLNSGIGHYEACSQPWEMGIICYKPSPDYPASVVLFQLHGGIISHMQVLATPSLAVHNTKYLILTTESILDLAASSWGSDVGM